MNSKFKVGQKVLFRGKIKCTVLEVHENYLVLNDSKGKNSLSKRFFVDNFDGESVESKVSIIE